MVTATLREALGAAFGASAKAGLADDALLDLALALYQRGGAAYPEVTLTAATFGRELARRLGDDASATVVAGLHHDLYLVIAAHGGDGVAAGRCDHLAQRELDFAAQRLRATSTQADDLRTELRRLLFTADDTRPAVLATFTGRGDLRGYLRVVVARALGRRLQRDRRERPLDDEVLQVLTSALDPETALLRERYQADVDAAFRSALAALPDRARAVLRYSLIDGWSIDELGDRYGVHRATAARWLAAARAELGARIRAALAERLVISESQVDSIVAMVASHVEVSLDRLLAP